MFAYLPLKTFFLSAVFIYLSIIFLSINLPFWLFNQFIHLFFFHVCFCINFFHLILHLFIYQFIHSSPLAVIQELALTALSRITQDAENCVTFRDRGGLDKLIAFLGNEEFNDLHVHALAVVSNCLEDTESLELIQVITRYHILLVFFRCVLATL